MPDNLYATLGVSKSATPAEIKAAYRRLVLEHHPDRAGENADASVFIEVTRAYEVLSDPSRRTEYDRLLALRNIPRPQAQRSGSRQDPPSASRSQRSPNPESDVRARVAADLGRLVQFYGRGAFADAERLARQILERDPMQATPYAILGDLARARGHIHEAAKMYAFAVQMDPRNPMYQRKHEELLGRLQFHASDAPLPRQSSPFPAMASFGLILAAAAYVALAKEPAVTADYAWISTWTFGLLVMLFLSGVALGAGLGLGGMVDRFESLSSNALNRVSPALALASIAIVNFWAAALIYTVVGLKERAYTYSVSRLILGVALTTLAMAAGAAGSKGIDPAQVLLWGGNLIYVGGICGWLVADTFSD
jgi:hypothetical protein